MESDPELKALVRQLADYERKISSLWWSFLRGMTYGLGFFAGSAILTAILIYFLTIAFKHSPFASDLQNLIDLYKSLKQ